ncbi:MAG: GH32 C-terminal domain-containing protein, partial [Tidjanibacter sp.]|nr:GH32 C-terminal domain-containing protein [Tidjanibacter sp.]
FDGAYSIDMTLLPKGDKEYGFRLCNSLNEYVEFRFNPAEGTLTLDRAKSGKTDFSPRYITTPIVTPVPESRSYELELYVDKHSTELFINDGDVVFTNCVFPNEPYDSIEFFSDGKTLKVEDFVIYKMQ